MILHQGKYSGHKQYSLDANNRDRVAMCSIQCCETIFVHDPVRDHHHASFYLYIRHCPYNQHPDPSRTIPSLIVIDYEKILNGHVAVFFAVSSIVIYLTLKMIILDRKKS